MCYNNQFDENAACELIANAHNVKQFVCGWTTNGMPCDTPVYGIDVPNHLRVTHGINDTERVICRWDACEEELNRGCLVRHVQEKHLIFRWPCPRCDLIFTRRGVMDKHRTDCRA